MSEQVLGTLAVRLRADSQRFERNLGNVRNQVQDTEDSLKALGVTAGATFAVLGFGIKKAVDAASDYSEALNVIDISFKDMAPGVKTWSKEVAAAMNASETQAIKFAGGMQLLLAPMFGVNETSSEMSKNLSMLAIDIKSAMGGSSEDAFIRLRSAMLGSTETAANFGANIKVAALNQFALTQGITKTYEKMNEQEKTWLRYLKIMKDTELVQGDMARTTNDWANVMEGTSNAAADLFRDLGTYVKDILTPFAIKVRDGVRALRDLSPEFKKIISYGALVTTALSGIAAASSGIALSISPLKKALAGLKIAWLKALWPVIAALGIIAAIILAAIVQVGFLRRMWTKHFKGVEKVIFDFNESVENMFADTFNWILKQTNNVVKELVKAWYKGKRILANLGEGKNLKDALFSAGFETDLAEKLGVFANVDMAKSIENAGSKFKSYISEANESLLELEKKVGKTIADELRASFKEGVDYFEEMAKKLGIPVEQLKKALGVLKGGSDGNLYGKPPAPDGGSGFDVDAAIKDLPDSSSLGSTLGYDSDVSTGNFPKKIEAIEKEKVSLKQAGLALAESMAGDMGETGAIFSDTLAAFKEGGIWAGIGAAINGVISQSAAMNKALKKFSDVLSLSLKALEPALTTLADIIVALIPLLKLTNSSITVVMGILKPVFTKISEGADLFTKFMRRFLSRWNGFVEFVATIAGWFSDKAADMIRSAMVITEEPEEQKEKEKEVIDDTINSIEDLGNAAQEVAEALLNVPEAFKIGVRRFESIVGETQGIGQGGGGNNGMNVFIDTVDEDKVKQNLKDASENDNYILGGTTSDDFKPFGVDQKGS